MITPNNILIIRTDRIGDVILSLPLAALIKKHFPECKVSFLLKEYTKDLLGDHPYIDDVIILQESNGKIPIFTNVNRLKSKFFDASIIVYPTFITALIVFLSRIKFRIGSGYRWYSFLFNKRIYEHRKYAEKHELEFNVNLLQAFGIRESISPMNVDFNIGVNKTKLEKVKNILSESGVDLKRKLVIAHPGSGGSAIDLPSEKFSQLVKNLTKLENTTLIITGSADETDICSTVALETDSINYAGQFDLSELTALISLCDVFISNSTGPIHIAAALGIFAVGFYPKILACSPERWGPYTSNKLIFMPEIECFDCTREQCERLNCMSSININHVTQEISKILNA